MSNIAVQDRLLPSILDRLSDDEPKKQKERRDDQVLSLNELRELVLRDLSWLLNSGNLECAKDLDGLSEVKRSVLNFGMPSFAGANLSTTNLSKMENDIRDAILTFEPRILPPTLAVRASLGDSLSFGRKTVSLEIEGQIWAQPYSLEFLLQSELDLETGSVLSKDKQES